MMPSMNQFRRVLAIDPTHRGFGFGVLEAREDLLIDWGVSQVSGDKKANTARKVAGLIHRYAPSAVIVEDTGHPKCLRRAQGRAVIKAIGALARTMEVPVVRIPMATVRKHYAEYSAKNKDTIARLIVARFPELRPFLPPPRKV